MTKKLKHLVLIFATCVFAADLSAQTDVKLLDLSVVPRRSSGKVPGDSIKLVVRFKINKANEAVKAHCWIGSVKDTGDIFIAEPVFTTVGTATSIVYNGTSEQITGYETMFHITLSRAQYSRFKAVTLFVDTSNGQQTGRLYYTKSK